MQYTKLSLNMTYSLSEASNVPQFLNIFSRNNITNSIFWLFTQTIIWSKLLFLARRSRLLAFMPTNLKPKMASYRKLWVNIYFHNVAEILDILTHFKQECPTEQKREQ